ncbi:MAG: AraC family transcriptional regulator, partial [Chloroflexi bacterium]|nr:AraC family transcriptional regulator [Chloroflexota bacterium]
DKEGALQSLDMMLDSLRNRPELTPASFKSHVLQMVVVLCRSATRIGADVITLTESSLQYAETIMNTDSYPALRAFLRGLVEELIVAALGRSRTPKSEIILLAKKYIAENYVKSPSLREVANFVNLSPHYFSRLFAKENDCGFQDYLNRVRIEAAKDLLRNSPVKVKQAAGRVGFKDVSHFVRLFRRVEGITPAEFTRSVGQVKI